MLKAGEWKGKEAIKRNKTSVSCFLKCKTISLIMLVNYDGKEKSTQANSQYKYTNHSNKVTLRVMYIHQHFQQFLYPNLRTQHGATRHSFWLGTLYCKGRLSYTALERKFCSISPNHFSYSFMDRPYVGSM